MFVVTADQRASRINDDFVPRGLDTVTSLAGSHLALPPERTAGDEFQVAVSDAPAVLDIVLQLTRVDTWSVGVGVGDIEQPLPANVRAARGTAFLNARDAVERAKRTPTRVSIVGGEDGADAEALVRLLVELRDRRTAEGWEIYDLLAGGLTQRESAARLGITEGAVSLRARTAALRAEEAAIPALQRALARADDRQAHSRAREG